MNVLFLCSRNRLRSPTAEHVFGSRPDLRVASAGLDRSAREQVTPELLAWADVIFVMEAVHRSRLQRRFRSALKDQRLICLGILDEYEFMDPDLVDLLRDRVSRHLPPRPP